MTYRNERQLTLDLTIIHACRMLVVDGMDGDTREYLDLLASATVELQLPPDKADKINRRALRLLRDMVEPCRVGEASVAKFGLVLFYVMRELIDDGRLVIEDGSALDQFCNSLLSEDGSLTELANISKVDSSAMKQAKKMREMIRKELGI